MKIFQDMILIILSLELYYLSIAFPDRHLPYILKAIKINFPDINHKRLVK